MKLFTTEDGKNYAFTFALVTTLFLLWGFCNGLIDVLNKHFQNSLQITKAQSGLVQFANYIGYFLMAIPAGLLAKRFGYKGGIIIGLALIAAGAFWFIPATRIGTYPAFLAGLFILATGLTCLETIANPYTTVLGPPESGATRINLAQTGNGVGWILGPIIGGHLIFTSGTDGPSTSNETLYLPYLGIGIVVAVIAVVFLVADVPELHAEEEFAAEAAGVSAKPLYLRHHFTLAVLAQFLYVAAQTGVFSFFINYVVENVAGVNELKASRWLGVGGFGLFMFGRLCGSVVVGATKPQAALAVYAFINVVLTGVAVAGLGWISVIALFGIFFFMSIMFPTIFALGIRGLGEHTKLASSLIVMSIVGGALAPPFMGRIADLYNMRLGFIVPLVCFVGVGLYGMFWQRLEARDAAAH
jgi:FHS family L-fucose permease-like MFS transporter